MTTDNDGRTDRFFSGNIVVDGKSYSKLVFLLFSSIKCPLLVASLLVTLQSIINVATPITIAI